MSLIAALAWSSYCPSVPSLSFQANSGQTPRDSDAWHTLAWYLDLYQSLH